MPNPTGQVLWKSGRPYVRIRIGEGKRPLLRLACATKQEAEKRADLVGDIVTKLRAMGRDSIVEELARRAAGARSPTDLDGIRIAVRAVCNEEVAARSRFDEAMTFEEFATKWTSGELHELYPKRIRVKRSAHLDAGLCRKWVFPHIGRLPLIVITAEHCEEVLEKIPETKSVFLTRQVAQVMARTLRLAVYPAKLLKECPIPRGFVPPIMKKRARTYLFPDEDRTLLGCKSVYLVTRLLYGVLAREGLRVDEALSLDVSDLDLKNGGVFLDRNKTDDPRSWALNPGVTDALRLWIRVFHPNPVPSSRVFVFPNESQRAGQPIESRSSARADHFRASLKKAGCRRPQLFEQNEDRRPICIHDLRATFVTISLGTGRTEAWVAMRTGHKSSKMINEYRRLASCHQELNMSPLDPLVDALPELAEARASAASSAAE